MPHFAVNGLVLNNLCFSPEAGTTLSEKLADCYKQYAESTVNLTQHSVIRQTIFISSKSNSEYHQNKRKLFACAKLFFEKVPPTSIIAQLPDNGSLIVEIVCIEGLKPGELTFKQNDAASWLVIQRNAMKMIVAAGLSENKESNCILQQSTTAFELLQNILLEEEMEFSDIIRQWNYIEKITAHADYNNSVSQHYQIFNDVRTKFYQLSNFENGFPAATGIGMDFGGITIDFIAAKLDSKSSIIGVKNPVQHDAYNYSEEVLAENSAMIDFCKTTPKFERAKVLITPEGKWLFVSGTAAITGELSSEQSCIKQQTEMTIQNIQRLISPENLHNYGIDCSGKVTLKYLRAYIKHKSHIPQVKEICRKHFPEVHIAFVVADVCRPELLIEIEGEAVIH
ncbi:MAG TPA: PTS cellobiose transporter subunit IIC [Prolixibacteraceae bacterium]|nr:PTS cellobiose transporter subunit IIC [Prolixibacteraceae bacterium]